MKKAYLILLLVCSILAAATGFYLGFTEFDSRLLRFVYLSIGTFTALTGCILYNIISERN